MGHCTYTGEYRKIFKTFCYNNQELLYGARVYNKPADMYNETEGDVPTREVFFNYPSNIDYDTIDARVKSLVHEFDDSLVVKFDRGGNSIYKGLEITTGPHFKIFSNEESLLFIFKLPEDMRNTELLHASFKEGIKVLLVNYCIDQGEYDIRNLFTDQEEGYSRLWSWLAALKPTKIQPEKCMALPIDDLDKILDLLFYEYDRGYEFYNAILKKYYTSINMILACVKEYMPNDQYAYVDRNQKLKDYKETHKGIYKEHPVDIVLCGSAGQVIPVSLKEKHARWGKATEYVLQCPATTVYNIDGTPKNNMNVSSTFRDIREVFNYDVDSFMEQFKYKNMSVNDIYTYFNNYKFKYSDGFQTINVKSIKNIYACEDDQPFTKVQLMNLFVSAVIANMTRTECAAMINASLCLDSDGYLLIKDDTNIIYDTKEIHCVTDKDIVDIEVEFTSKAFDKVTNITIELTPEMAQMLPPSVCTKDNCVSIDVRKCQPNSRFNIIEFK